MRVALFPFEIVSEKGLSYLQQVIPKIVNSRFAAAEIATEILDTPVDFKEETLRKISIGNDCTHAIWGKLVWEADQFHLSAFLMETTVMGPPRAFTATGESIENLLGGSARFAAGNQGIIRASTLSHLAGKRLTAGEVDAVEDLVPVYIRKSDAEIHRLSLTTT